MVIVPSTTTTTNVVNLAETLKAWCFRWGAHRPAGAQPVFRQCWLRAIRSFFLVNQAELYILRGTRRGRRSANGSRTQTVHMQPVLMCHKHTYITHLQKEQEAPLATYLRNTCVICVYRLNLHVEIGVGVVARARHKNKFDVCGHFSFKWLLVGNNSNLNVKLENSQTFIETCFRASR